MIVTWACAMPQGGPQGAQAGAGPPQGAAPTPAPATTGGGTSAVVPGQEGGQLTTAMLAAATPDQQKQMLGERLFPLVHNLQVCSALLTRVRVEPTSASIPSGCPRLLSYLYSGIRV